MDHHSSISQFMMIEECNCEVDRDIIIQLRTVAQVLSSCTFSYRGDTQDPCPSQQLSSLNPRRTSCKMVCACTSESSCTWFHSCKCSTPDVHEAAPHFPFPKCWSWCNWISFWKDYLKGPIPSRRYYSLGHWCHQSRSPCLNHSSCEFACAVSSFLQADCLFH